VFKHIISVLTVAIAMLESIAFSMRLWWYGQHHNSIDPFGNDNAICRPVSAQDAANRDFIRTAQVP